MEKYTIEYLHSAATVFAVQAEWQELFRRSSASPYLSHEWFATVLTVFPGAARLCVAMVRQSRRLQVIVPLQISKRRLGFLPLSLLEPACGGWATRCAALVPAGREEEELNFIEMVIADLPEQGILWDCCRLPGIAASTPGLRMPAASRDPFRRQIIPIGSSVIIDLPPTWAEYRASVSKNQRKKLAYRLNLFARAGRGRLVRLGFDPPGRAQETLLPVCGPQSGAQALPTGRVHLRHNGPDLSGTGFELGPAEAELDRLLEDALRVSRKSWQHSAATGWAISNPGSGDFFVRVSHQLAAARLLDLSVLYLDDRPVSFIWGAVAGTHAHINKLGFDRDLAELSPGFVHLALYIEDSIARGLSDADFGHEFHEYKSAWGQRGIDLVDIYYYSGGARALALRAVRALRRRQQAPQPRPQEE